jgi:hypothetical protein
MAARYSNQSLYFLSKHLSCRFMLVLASRGDVHGNPIVSAVYAQVRSKAAI